MTETQRKTIAVAVVAGVVGALALFTFLAPHIGVPFVIAVATAIFGSYVGDNMRVRSEFALVLLLVIAVALTVVSAAPWAVGLAFIGVAGTAGGILAGAVN